MEYKRWNVSEKDLENLTPEKAKDLIEKCIFEAQNETIKTVAQAQGKGISEDVLKGMVTDATRDAFDEVGGSYDKPNYGSLYKVVYFFAANSGSWGTTSDIIAHHKKQMEIVLDKLKGDSNNQYLPLSEHILELMKKDIIPTHEFKDALEEVFSYLVGSRFLAKSIIKKQANNLGINWNNISTKEEFNKLIDALLDVVMADFPDDDKVINTYNKMKSELSRCECSDS